VEWGCVEDSTTRKQPRDATHPTPRRFGPLLGSLAPSAVITLPLVVWPFGVMLDAKPSECVS